MEAARELQVENAIIEGEAVVTGVNGQPDFDRAAESRSQRSLRHDLGVHLDGHDLRDIG